ncbi:aminoacyl tRNA synthase complex-interacting multifunctional protein 2 [Electrophorus electricus]|uniref:Protein JTV-1 n=1 Tax=Electrophorus electricus TaxID=8005 RepID=A0A4W4EB79_ELEEL|nr:aminoacyl tRNA synthase complex-interacting multifunctional protein 2 [Electrophorus electricus]
MPMYQLKPICGSDIKIDLPACMYKLPNIHAQQGSGCAEHALQNGDVDPALKALEARQDEILRKLYDLKAAVDGLAKTVTTPDADLDATTLPQSPTGSPFTGTADLDALLGKDVGALRDIVVNANPANPPFSLLVLHGLLCRRYRVLSSVYVHSSVTSVPPQLLSCLGQPPADSYTRDRFQLGFTLIWKDVPTLQMKFSTPSMCPIEGEANVARFLFRLLGAEPRDPVAATRADCWVDVGIIQLAEGSAKERAAAVRALNAALGCSPWLLGSELSLADIVCACSLLWAGQADAAPANVKRWLQACRNLGHFDCVYTLLQ